MRESDYCCRGHTSKGEDISRRREANTVDPSASRAGVFSADSVEGKFFTPDVGSRSILDGLVPATEQLEYSTSLFVHFLDVRGEDPCLGVGTPGSQKDVVGMPVDAEDGASNRFLKLLGSPPLSLVVEGADTDIARARGDCELVLVGRPADIGRRAVDPEDDERGLPDYFAGRGIGDLSPDIGITILRAGNDAVCVWSPVNRSDKLVVLWTDIWQR